jgi:hypothetical protein
MMKRSHIKKVWHALFFSIMILGVLLFIGCGGSGDTGAQGPPGPPGPTVTPTPTPETTTGETCDVCHGASKVADIAVKHPDPTGLDVTLSNITLTNNSGDITVTFHAATAAGPVTGLVLDDFKFMIADLVPAGTDTLGGWGTWDSPYFERWAYESPPSPYGTYPQGTLTNLGSGNYSYVFDTSFADATTEAPDYNEADTQRLAIIVAGHGDFTPPTNNTVGFVDFKTPAAGGAVTTSVSQRLFVTVDACKKCHSPLFQKAHHADTYLDTRACVICHSPIGHYGTEMQDDAAYLSVMVHQIHDAVTGPRFDWSDVTYPQSQQPDVYNGAEKCVVCHTDSGLNLGSGNEIDNWKTHPTAEICSSCHVNVNFTTGANHPGGVQTNADCNVCHLNGTSFSLSVTQAHDTTLTGKYVPEFDVAITMTPPANGTYYVAGEAPEVTVSLKNSATGLPVAPTVYSTPQDVAGHSGGGLSEADLFVYGPRAKSVPVLTTGSTTDPNYDSATDDPPSQGHELFVNGSDPQVKTNATSNSFVYQLLPIPADMTAGTYMVRFEGADYGGLSGTDFVTHSTALINFQVGTGAVEDKVSGDACINCHGDTRMHLTGIHAHDVPFNTDYCLGCHDQSGNFAIPIANRVHAVHSANPDGDIYNINNGSVSSSRDWSDVTFPQNILSPVTGHAEDDGLPRCVGCHNSGDVTYKTLPYMMPCVGCHADAANTINKDPDLDHMRQNGGPF